MIFIRIVTFIECLLGIILLGKEIVSYFHLPSVQWANDHFNGCVDFFKYKEDCYKNFFLYSLLIITGLSFWISRKLYWGMTQALLITLLFVIMINLWYDRSFKLGVNIFFGIILLILFVYLEKKMFNSLFLQTMGVNKITKWLCFFGGGLSCAIWLILF